MENLEKLVNAIVEAIDDKKGKGIVSLDSTTQVDAISSSIEEKVFEVMGEWPVRVEGRQNAFWVAMDYTDVIVHIFQTELREYYRLEELWADAPMKRYDFGE